MAKNEMIVASEEDFSNIDYTSCVSLEPETKKKYQNTKKTEVDPTRKGQVFNVMNQYNLGSIMFCLIPDRVLTVIKPGEKGHPRLIRQVLNGMTGTITTADNKYLSFQIPQLVDFQCKLTKDQSDAVTHLRDLGRNFMEFTSYTNRDKFPEINKRIRISSPRQSVFTYGKLIKFISRDKGDTHKDEIGHVRIFKFDKGEVGKTDFQSVFNAVIQSRNEARGSCKWMNDFFNRNLGTHSNVVSVKSSQIDGPIKKYALNVSLEEVAPFEINEEDLSIANDLNNRVFNIESFDDEAYNNLVIAFDELQSYLDSLSAEL